MSSPARPSKVALPRRRQRSAEPQGDGVKRMQPRSKLTALVYRYEMTIDGAQGHNIEWFRICIDPVAQSTRIRLLEVLPARLTGPAFSSIVVLAIIDACRLRSHQLGECGTT